MDKGGVTVELLAVRVDQPLTEGEERMLLPLLPPWRRERLLQTRRERWGEPLCAYALLGMTLNERYGWRTLPELAVTEQGKPFFPGAPEVQFSLSHTRGAALVGLSDRPVGVDVERLRPVRAAALRRTEGAASETDFFQTWVRREARCKLRGVGIAAMLHGEPPLAPEEHYREVTLFPGYVAGAAVLGSAPVVSARVIPLEELMAFVEQLCD